MFYNNAMSGMESLIPVILPVLASLFLVRLPIPGEMKRKRETPRELVLLFPLFTFHFSLVCLTI
jgi:hypothetical protein